MADTVKDTFLQRHSFLIMAVVGVVVAGTVSFFAATYFHTSAGSGANAPGPKRVPVVYIDTGAILTHVIRAQDNGRLTPRQMARMGHTVGATIQEVADGYAREGDIVLTRDVLAVPASNNVTELVEKAVDARLAAARNTHDG